MRAAAAVDRIPRVISPPPPAAALQLARRPLQAAARTSLPPPPPPPQPGDAFLARFQFCRRFPWQLQVRERASEQSSQEAARVVVIVGAVFL